MLELALHHVSIPTRDLAASCLFYETVLGLERIKRPPFSSNGAWYGIGPLQIHVVAHADANFRNGKSVESNDIHFALKADDFEKAVAHLKGHGFDENLPADHPKKLILRRTGAAGFPQLYFLDPDRNIIEINTAPYNAR